MNRNFPVTTSLIILILLALLSVFLFSSGCLEEPANNDIPETVNIPKKDDFLAPEKDFYEETVHLGILQFAQIPALDSAREGILKALAYEGFVEGENLVVHYQNAEGDFERCEAIAEEFLKIGVDLIIATATPAVQAVAAVAKDIPVVFAAVTEPQRAGVVESWERPGRNVTGVSDLNPVGALLEMVLAIVPHAQKFGVIYNANEINSVVQVEISRRIAEEIGIEIIEAAVTRPGEVRQAAAELAGEADIIWVPSDNTIMSAFDTVVEEIKAKNKMAFGANIKFAEMGAVCAIGFDYFELGLQAGVMVAAIIRGADPALMPVQIPTEIHIAINLDMAEKVGYKIPFEVLLVADEIFM